MAFLEYVVCYAVELLCLILTGISIILSTPFTIFIIQLSQHLFQTVFVKY